jgi:hypothetical protein
VDELADLADGVRRAQLPVEVVALRRRVVGPAGLDDELGAARRGPERGRRAGRDRPRLLLHGALRRTLRSGRQRARALRVLRREHRLDRCLRDVLVRARAAALHRLLGARGLRLLEADLHRVIQLAEGSDIFDAAQKLAGALAKFCAAHEPAEAPMHSGVASQALGRHRLNATTAAEGCPLGRCVCPRKVVQITKWSKLHRALIYPSNETTPLVDMEILLAEPAVRPRNCRSASSLRDLAPRASLSAAFLP